MRRACIFTLGLAVLGMTVLNFSSPAYATYIGARTDNCLIDRILNSGGANQTVVLENKCTENVEYAICLNRGDVSWNGFKRGTIRANRSVRLYVSDLPPNTEYNYQYNWCWGDACRNQRIPDC